MTAAHLIRHLRRNVVKPILKTKRDTFQLVCSVASPRRPSQVEHSTGADVATVRTTETGRSTEPGRVTRAAAPDTESTKSPGVGQQASSRTKADLYEEATAKRISGRSTMNKAELLAALGYDD